MQATKCEAVNLQQHQNKKKIICGRHNNQTAPDELYKIMEEINSKMIALFSASQLLWCSKNWL